MTLKDMMLGSAVAALIAGSAVAQDTTAPADPTMPSSESATGEEMPSNTETGDMETTPDTTMSSEEPMSPDEGSGMAADTDMAETPESIAEMTVGEVVGKTVTGVDDETIGEVDYVIAQEDGKAFVIGIGGFLGLGEYTVAIPADQFSVTEDGYLHLASMTRSDLEAQPEFNEEGVEELDGEVMIGSAS